MKNAAASLSVFTEYINRITMRFSVMNIKGYIKRNSHLYLFNKDFLLKFPRRFGPIIIKTDLSDSNNFRISYKPIT